MDDYTTLFDEATEHARKAYYANGRMAETVSSEWLYRVRDALQALVTENTEQRSRIAALEALIGRVRGLVRDRNWAETLARDVTGAMFPQLVDMDDLRRILECSPSSVLDQMIREAKAEARKEAFREAADAVDRLGHNWSGTVATALFEDANRLRANGDA